MIDGLTGDQRFFLAYAQVWREKYRDGALRELVMSDVHSPTRFRVNGPLPNIDAWYAGVRREARRQAVHRARGARAHLVSVGPAVARVRHGGALFTAAA